MKWSEFLRLTEEAGVQPGDELVFTRVPHNGSPPVLKAEFHDIDIAARPGESAGTMHSVVICVREL